MAARSRLVTSGHTPGAKPEGVGDILSTLAASKAYERFRALFRGEDRETAPHIGGCAGSAPHLLVAVLSAERNAPPALLLVASDQEARAAARDLKLLGVEGVWLVRSGRDEALDRMRSLIALAGKPPKVVIASAAAAADPTPAVGAATERLVRLKTGGAVSEEELARVFAEAGFRRVAIAAAPGEFSARGDVIDVFDRAAKFPLRVETFDGRVEGLRRFDPATQISIETLDAADVSLFDPDATAETGSLADHLPASTVVLLREPLRFERAAAVHLELIDPSARDASRARLERLRAFREISVTRVRGVDGALNLGSHPIAAEGASFESALKTLERVGRGKSTTWLGFDGEAERRRFFDAVATSDAPEAKEIAARAILATDEPLSEGFHAPLLGVACLAHHELFAVVRARREASDAVEAPPESRPLETFLDLRDGDFVVHLVHGVAKFLGLERAERGGKLQDFLVLEFHDGAHVRVPATKIDLVQKYVGGRGEAPELSKIGSTGWRRRKAEVADAVAELAADLLELQAVRARARGISHAPDGAWQREFEAAFPHRLTACQATAIEAIKKDLESERPMDRLLCGDVGYGKTELAARAAFKVAAGGRQTAILAPTTILVEQHWNTLRARMADYPMVVECLSRFRSEADTRRAVERLADGSADVVVGTHRLLRDGLTFKNLGLLVVDEEQKFGVLHKEKLRRLRREVDVLTLSATPIPRTLHQAMTGIRDISTLTEPPPGRRSVKTEVVVWDDALIRRAILREMDRAGQTFFIHNRVETIDKVVTRIRAIVPEARIVVGHGQMGERALEGVMKEFLERRADVLVATTIVESGLDIPTVNTVFVDRADMFGLAELHQLRGRAGRGAEQAFAYFLVRPDTTPSEVAEKRLLAIEEFSRLGAGFQLSIRDLEIRGAGNLLGKEQSGHIASVGYELYCRLLEGAVKRLKREDVVDPEEVELFVDFDAYLPETYVADKRLRLDVYRKFGRARTESDFGLVLAELRDRFGPPPPEVAEMADMAKIRALMERRRVGRLEVLKDEGVVLGAKDVPALARKIVVGAVEARLVTGRGLVLVRPAPFRSPRELLDFLKTAFGETQGERDGGVGKGPRIESGRKPLA